MDTGAEHNPST